MSVLHAAGCSVASDLEEGRAYACDIDATDAIGPPQCAEGWRCGREQLCIEDEVAARATCIRDDECAAGFVCGVDSKCRNAEVNGPYPCRSDADCGPSWTCGTEDVCVDPVLEAPSTSAPFSLIVSGERLHPAHLTPPDAFSIGYRSTSEATTVSSAHGPTVVGYDIRSFSTSVGSVVADAPFVPVRSSLAVFSETPKEVVGAGEAIWFALLSDGLHVAHADGGTALVEPRLAGFDDLAVSAFFVAPHLLTAWDESRVAAGAIDAGTIQLVPLGEDGGVIIDGPVELTPVVVREVAAGRGPFGTPDRTLYAVTDHGLYAREVSPFASWLPIARGRLAHQDCVSSSAAPDLVPMAIIDAVNHGQVIVLAATQSSPVTWFRVQLQEAPATSEPCGGALFGRTLELAAQPCAVCPEGARAVDVRRSHARCEMPAGSGIERTYRVAQGSGTCALVEMRDPAGPRPTTHYRAVRETPAYATSDGLMYGGSSGLLPLLLNRMPRDLIRVQGRLSASTFEQVQPFPAEPLFVEFFEVPGLGLARPADNPFGNARPLPASQKVDERFILDPRNAVIRDARGWSDGGVPPVVATLDPAVTTGLRLPATVHAAGLPDGGELLVVSSFDLLMSANLSTGADVNGVPPVLTTRLSPAPRMPLRDVVLVPAKPPNLVEGFALTDNALTWFRAPFELQWEERRLELPPGDPLGLFVQEGRAWIGYRDGRVFSLPARLPVAAGTADETFFDFASVCGRTYAATSRGLKRLDPAGASLGTWVPEPQFATELPSPSAEDLAQSRLFTGDRELFWAGGRGTLLRFELGSPCP